MALDRMDSLKRTHYCGTLRVTDDGKEVVVFDQGDFVL